MSFPYYFSLFGFNIHPHFLFEFVAYFIGYRIFSYLKYKEISKGISKAISIGMFVFAVIGAIVFSKILAWFESPLEYLELLNEFSSMRWLVDGKTIVGGLIGGWLGVEYYKKRKGIFGSSGDYYAIPLILGMMIGRIGCFLTGLEDKTFGTETDLITGIDFGDGVLRHPTQLYEIIFLVLLLIFIRIFVNKLKVCKGLEFQVFLATYLYFRFLIEFIKPVYLYPWQLSMIQTISFVVALFVSFLIFKKLKEIKCP